MALHAQGITKLLSAAEQLCRTPLQGSTSASCWSPHLQRRQEGEGLVRVVAPLVRVPLAAAALLSCSDTVALYALTSVWPCGPARLSQSVYNVL